MRDTRSPRTGAGRGTPRGVSTRKHEKYGRRDSNPPPSA